MNDDLCLAFDYDNAGQCAQICGECEACGEEPRACLIQEIVLSEICMYICYCVIGQFKGDSQYICVRRLAYKNLDAFIHYKKTGKFEQESSNLPVSLVVRVSLDPLAHQERPVYYCGFCNCVTIRYYRIKVEFE